jgi:hypothetical protein
VYPVIWYWRAANCCVSYVGATYIGFSAQVRVSLPGHTDALNKLLPSPATIFTDNASILNKITNLTNRKDEL